ncbi:MAG TPA: terminase small subunit [Gemmata sp.]
MGTRARRHLRKPALSAREVRFCALFAEYGNATRCYLDAGFPEDGTAAAITKRAARLLRRAPIADYIRTLQASAADAAKATVETIAQGLLRSANKDLRRLYDHQGRLRPPHEWPDELAAVIEAVETEERFETVESIDPDTNKTVRRRELVGYVRKVRTTNRTEAQKVLSAWRRMTGPDVPRLEVLLNALPPDVARIVRNALLLALPVQPGGDPPGAPEQLPGGTVGGDARMDAV